MTVLQAILNINTMSYDEIVNGFNNVKVGVEEFFNQEQSVLEIRLFLKDKFDIDLPYYVKDEVEYSAYIAGYTRCLTNLVSDGLAKNNSLSMTDVSKIFMEVLNYRDEFTKIVTDATIEAYNRKDLGVA
nr:MAG TPA: hypothetical protein [Caudoviricetes sp.]